MRWSEEGITFRRGHEACQHKGEEDRRHHPLGIHLAEMNLQMFFFWRRIEHTQIVYMPALHEFIYKKHVKKLLCETTGRQVYMHAPLITGLQISGMKYEREHLYFVPQNWPLQLFHA